jgi:lipopolysaccharide export system permease protein
MSLSAFDMHKTEEDQFRHHQIMRGLSELAVDSDSLKKSYKSIKEGFAMSAQTYFMYELKHFPKNMTKEQALMKKNKNNWIDSLVAKKITKVKNANPYQNIDFAISQAGSMETFAESSNSALIAKEEDYDRTDLEWHHKFTNAIAVFVMFLIGAPLGGIIKKGGFGLPVVVAIIFFILMYVMTQQGDKAAKESRVIVQVGAWISNTVLFLIGLYFLNKARNDSRLFESDVYAVYLNKAKEKFQNSKIGGWILNKFGVSFANTQ